MREHDRRMKHTPQSQLAAGALALALCALPLQAATTELINQSFDTMRLNADDPDREDLKAAGWYSWNSNTQGAYAGIATAPTGMSGRVLSVGGSSANSYIYTQWNAVSLANVGDSLTLNVAARAGAMHASNPYEFTLLDSSNVLTENSKGGTEPMATASGFSYRINSTGEALLAYTEGTPSTLVSDSNVPAVFDSTVYNYSFSVTVTSAETATIRMVIDGTESLSFEQSFEGLLGFNTLRMRSSTGAQWDDVVLTHTTIPEPSAAGVLAGITTLGFVAGRRRRR